MLGLFPPPLLPVYIFSTFTRNRLFSSVLFYPHHPALLFTQHTSVLTCRGVRCSYQGRGRRTCPARADRCLREHTGGFHTRPPPPRSPRPRSRTHRRTRRSSRSRCSCRERRGRRRRCWWRSRSVCRPTRRRSCSCRCWRSRGTRPRSGRGWARTRGPLCSRGAEGAGTSGRTAPPAGAGGSHRRSWGTAGQCHPAPLCPGTQSGTSQHQGPGPLGRCPPPAWGSPGCLLGFWKCWPPRFLHPAPESTGRFVPTVLPWTDGRCATRHHWHSSCCWDWL